MGLVGRRSLYKAEDNEIKKREPNKIVETMEEEKKEGSIFGAIIGLVLLGLSIYLLFM